MICKECGCPYDANQSSCPECGCPSDSIASATEVKDDLMVCPYCGAPIEGLKVCQWCGKPLEEDTEDIENIEQESISSDTSNTAEKGIEYEQNDSVLSDTQNIASPSIDLNKKKPLSPWYIAIPAGVLLTVFFCVLIVRSREDHIDFFDSEIEDDVDFFDSEKENEVEFNSDVEAISSRMFGQRVYSWAYDGFTNIREDTSFSAKVIGQFRNGPEGAILLEDFGEWMKIDISGQIGYVVSKYVRDAPSVAYTGDITVGWLEGIWGSSDSGFNLLIFNNGTWEMGYDYTFVYGKYLLQNTNELVLIPVKEINPEGDWISAEDSDIEIVKINKAKNLLEYSGTDYHKEEYMSQEAMDEGYGGYGCLTKSEFKSYGKKLLQSIENR